MTKSIEKRAFDSTIAGIALFVISFFQSIILVPFFLKYWGNEKYSIWLTLYAFVNLMRTLDTGHQNYIGNEFNKLYHQDKGKARQLLGSSFKIAYLLGLFELLIYLLILFTGLQEKAVGINEGSYNVSWGIISFLVMWLLVGSAGGILVKIILPIGKYSRSLYLNIIIKVLETLSIVVCLYLNTSINMLCFIVAACWLVYTLYLFYDIRHLMPEFYPWWKGGSMKEGFSNLAKSVVVTLNGFVEQFSLNGILVFIASIVGVLKVPAFTTLRTIGNTFTQATTIVLNPLIPDLIRFHVKKEHGKIGTIIVANWFISCLIVNLPLLLLVPFIKPLFEWWTKGQVAFDLILYLTITLSISLVNYGKTFVVYLTGINNLRALTLITFSRFVIIFVIGLPLLKYYGLQSLGWSFLLAEAVSSVIIPFFFVKKQLAIEGVYIERKAIILSLLPIVLLAVYYCIFYYFQSIFLLLFFIFLFGVILQIQWKSIDEEIRKRLLGFLPVFIRK